MERAARVWLLGLAIIGGAACVGAAGPSSPTIPGPTAPPEAAVTVEPEATPGPTVPPGTTPFPTPGPTITPGSTRVIGTLVRPDGSPAAGVCVVLEKGICPIATDDRGMWFTDIPAGPLNWTFIYKIDGQEAGRQFIIGSSGGELRLAVYTLTG